MGTHKNASIVQATEKDIDRLTRLIRESFADVALRFKLTPENCPKHPSNYNREWVKRDLARGVRYFILFADGDAVGCVGVEKAPPASDDKDPEPNYGKAGQERRLSPPSTSDNAVQDRYPEVYMERLAVLPQHRGQGYGTRLVRHAIGQARKLNASTVGIGIIAADAGLKDFYKSFGFEEGETKSFPHLPFAVVFLKLLV